MRDNGMHCMDPSSVWIGPKVKVGRDVTIHPSVQLWGETVVEDGVFIGSFTVLRNSVIHENANIKGLMITTQKNGRKPRTTLILTAR